MRKVFKPIYPKLVITGFLFISVTVIAQSPFSFTGLLNDPSTFAFKPTANAFNILPGFTNGADEVGEYVDEDPNVPHNLTVSGACVPGTTNRFSGSWHSNMYIGNNNGVNVLLAWGQNMSSYITGAGTNYTSPQEVSAASYSGVPYEVKSSSSGGANGLSALALRTSTNLYFFGTAANLTAVTTMASFGGASLIAANSNVTAKLPAGVAITDIAFMELSQTAFAIVTNAGHVYILTKVANLEGDIGGTDPAVWHHVTLSDGTTFLSGVTKLSLCSSGALAATSNNKLYYWGAPANVAGVTNTTTSYNYAYDMSAQIPSGRIVKDVVCLGTKVPSPSTLFILCDNRKVYACGLNTNGCLGINNATTTFNQATFITVKGTDGSTDLSGIVRIDGDTESDLFCIGAISNTGQIYGWGDSQAAMLGVNGSTTSFAVPRTSQLFTPTPGLNFNEFSVAGHFTIAFYSSGGTDQYWYLGHNVGGSVGDPANATAFILSAAPASLNSTGGITYECSNVFLPLSWLSFNAQKQSNNILLNWSTASEQNTTDFEVQHSTDGIMWHVLGSIGAAGNSSSTEHYSFVHNNPVSGINYYRLRQNDMDNHSSYSKTISVLFTGKTKQPLINPNTVLNGIINLQLQEPAMVYVYNSTGVLVLKQQLAAGRQTLNAATLAKGIYFLRAGAETEKFIIE